MKLNRTHHTRAFSLIEMLVVITIIGIIAAFAIPQIGRPHTKIKEEREAAAKKAAEEKQSAPGSNQAPAEAPAKN